MNKNALQAWAAPWFEWWKSFEGAIRDTFGDASMLAAAEKAIREMPPPDFFSLAEYLADDMQEAAARSVREWAEGIERARHEVALFTVENPGFEPILAAIEKIAGKTPVTSALRTRGWENVPLALREGAQFSAGVESIRMMGNIQDKLLKAVSHQRDYLAGGAGRYVTRDVFIDIGQKIAREEGLDTGAGNILTNIASERRLGLIYDMQTKAAAGYARWKLDNDADALAIIPAWRLGPSTAKVPRGDDFWMGRWIEAGTEVGWEGAARNEMVALKTSPIWSALSRFGTPWPPFDFGSTRELEDVWRDEAEALGLVDPGDVLDAVAEKQFNEDMEASASQISAPLVQFLKDAFGDQMQWNWSEQKFVWQGKMMGDLWEKAHANAIQGVKSLHLGRATPKAIKLAMESGVDLDGYEMQVQASNARHVDIKHGEHEAMPEQRELTKLDFEMAPHVIRFPDAVRRPKNPHKDKIEPLEFEKVILGRTVIMTAKRSGKKLVVDLNSMWVKK